MHPEQEAPVRIAVRDVEPGTVLAVLSGEIDYDITARFEDALRRVLLERRPQMLALSMVSVDFCDCAALHTLVRVHEEGDRLSCRVVISDASPAVGWLLELFGLDRLFGYPAAAPNSGVARESRG